MKRIIYIAVFFSLFKGFSQVEEPNFSIDELESFFKLYEEDVALAVQSTRTAYEIVNNIAEADMKILISDLKLLKELKKTYHGYEISTKKHIGNSYAKVTCLVKHDVPFFIIFGMYKPNKYWMIRELTLRKNYRKLFSY